MKKLLTLLLVPITLLAMAAPAQADNSNNPQYLTSLGHGLCALQQPDINWVTSTGTPRQWSAGDVYMMTDLSGGSCSIYTDVVGLKVNSIGAWTYIEGKPSVNGTVDVCVSDYAYNSQNDDQVSTFVPGGTGIIGIQCPTTDTWIRGKEHTAYAVNGVWVFVDRYTAWIQVNP